MSNKDDSRYNDDYNSANEALIKRETQKFERAKQRAESLERNMTKGLACAIRDQRSKVASEAGKAVSRSESGQLSETERKMIEAARRGGSEGSQVFIDEGTITGFEEKGRYRYDEDE